MARYPRQDDKGGKNVIPSVTEIIGDCTDKSAPLTQWAANMTVEWIRENHLPLNDDDGIYYEVDDSKLNEARFNFKKVSQKALDIGSEVHKLIEAYLLTIMKSNCMSVAIMHGFIQDARPEVNNAFNAFLQWKEEHNLKPIALEQTVYGDGWAGTLDFYGYFGDRLYVIDWKSSKAHYPEMRYQVAAYRWAMDEKIYDDNVGGELWLKDRTIPEIDGCGVLRLDKETGLPDWKDTSKSYEQDLRIFNRMVDLYFERHPIIRKRARG